MVKERFNKEDIIKYNDGVLPLVKKLEPIYSIVARARSYRIKGEDDIIIDIHLTGLGIPDANKFIFLWSSPNVIDTSKEGDCVWCTSCLHRKRPYRGVTTPGQVVYRAKH